MITSPNRPTLVESRWDAGYSAALEVLRDLGTHRELVYEVERRRDERRDHRDEAEREKRRESNRARLAAVRACPRCDDLGYLTTGHLCDHDPRAGDRLRRGIAAARSALGNRTRPYTPEETEEVTPR